MAQLKREWRASMSMGRLVLRAVLSHRAPRLLRLDCNHRQAEIAGIALSTTSLAVVYAVLVETGLNQTLVGKRLMSATFVQRLRHAAALLILFIKPTLWIAAFGE